MGIFDRFPYSSTHEMNLDFMLGKATEIAESLQEVQDGLSDIDTHKAQAEQAAQAAQASQAAASASAGQAAQHVTNAEDAADRAEAASTEAETAADRAETALGNITNAETVCTEAAEEAQQYAQASQSHSNQAMLYKNDAETAKNNAAVSASQAAISAGSAANSATDAASSASSANVSATNANLHASNAETSATNAATSATNAATSATNAAASANGIQEAADHVESLVESLPEDFTDLNNTVNQLSDEIDNIGLEMAYCSDDKLQKFGKNIYIQKPSALNTQATICVFNASAGVTYTINLTTKEEIQGTIYVYVYKDASISAWKSYVIDASTPTKNVNFTLSTDTKITIKYLEQNSTNTILTGVITVSSDEAETKAKETAYLLNSPLTLGIPLSVRQNYFLQDNGDNTGAIASAINFTLLQYDLSNVVGTIDVKTVLNGSSCIGFYADGVYSPVTKNQGKMQIPAGAEYLYVSLYTGSGATINNVVVRADFSVQVAINRSVIYGKKLGVFGDSIIAGNGYSGGWAKIIAARNHMSVDNAAISGGTIMNISEHPHIPEQIANIDSDCDYVLFDGGVNDFALQDFVLGEISANYINSPAYDTTTFIGSLEKLLYDLRSAFVGKKIGYVFNHRIYRDNDVNGTVKYSEFEATVKSILKKWGVAYVDIAEDSPSLNLLDAYKDAYTAHTESFPNGDGWHPNYEGYKTYYCNKIESWMKTL